MSTLEKFDVITSQSCVSVEPEVDVSDCITAFTAHPDSSTLIIGYWKGTVEVYSLNLKRSLFRNNEFPFAIRQVEVLNDDLFGVIAENWTLRIFSIQGKRRLQTLSKNHLTFHPAFLNVTNAHSFTVAGTYVKRFTYYALSVFEFDETSSTYLNLSGDSPRHIRANCTVAKLFKNYLCLFTNVRDRAVPDTYIEIRKTNIDHDPKRLHLRNEDEGSETSRLFHAASCGDKLVLGNKKELLLYDSVNFNFLGCLFKTPYKLKPNMTRISMRSMHNSRRIDNCHSLGANHLLVQGVFEREETTFTVFNMSTCERIWEAKFERAVSWNSISLVPDGRIVIQANSNSLLVVKPPEEVRKQLETFSGPAEITEGQSEDIAPPPLLKALVECLIGTTSPCDVCSDPNLITPGNCSKSIAEWSSAHQILMLAAQDEPSMKTTSFNEEESYWLENLYSSFKDLSISNKNDHNALKKMLRQAQDMGVIRNMEVPVGDRITLQQVERDVSELRQAAHQTNQYLQEQLEKNAKVEQRLNTTERNLQLFYDHYQIYRENQRISSLINVALQLIPIAGGAIQCAVAAGIEMIGGISEEMGFLEDVPSGPSSLENPEELPSEGIGERPAGIAGSIFEEAIKALDNMNEEQSEQVSEMLVSFGETVQMLRDELEERSEGVAFNRVPKSTQGKLSAQNIDSSEKSTFTLKEGEVNVVARLRKRVRYISTIPISDLKGIYVDVKSIATLSSEDLARVLAAGLVLFRDDKEEEFNSIRLQLNALFEKHDIVGMVLNSENVIRAVEAMIVDMFKSNELWTIGKTAMLSSFFEQFRV